MGDIGDTRHKMCTADGPPGAACLLAGETTLHTAPRHARPMRLSQLPHCFLPHAGFSKKTTKQKTKTNNTNHPTYGSASPTLSSCTFGPMGFTAVGRTRLPSKEPFPPHAAIHTADRTRVIRAPVRGLDFVQIVEPKRVNDGPHSLPDRLRRLRTTLERTTARLQHAFHGSSPETPWPTPTTI